MNRLCLPARVLCVLLMAATPGPLLPNDRAVPSAQSLRAIEQQVHDYVNRERIAAGLARLVWSDRLAAEARRHSRNMAEHNFFAHSDPSRGDVGRRLDEAEIAWTRCAENLYEQKGGGEYARQAVRAWLRSPTHRRNMLDAGLKQTGVGVTLRRDGTVIIVQEFMR